ncbi:MAG TPA: IS3 family transposase [Cyclobacteriaceae bacterium]|nr:IS3 family transposase [Cyclobacteriaceae bacterium]
MKDDVSVLCELASVSRAGYYKWLKTADEEDKDYPDYLAIKRVFDEGKGKYGWRSIKMRLAHMNHKKIQRIMRKYELRATVRKRNPYKQMMKKSLEHRVFPNKLQRKFDQPLPYKVFCTDITYIPFLNHFAYLSVIKDIASGEVMAWNLSLSMEVALVTETVKNIKLNSYEGIMIHSDQGFHYTNPSYIKTIKELRMIQSMSCKGKCIDNAPIESFFGHMKDEIDYKSCQSFEQLRFAINEYI